MTTDFFKEPDGFQWGHFADKDGADIRYGHVKPAGEVKGSVVIVTGFRECIEKYFDAAREMMSQGLEVWMMDWRGQGGSERYLKDNPQKAHHTGYDSQIACLHKFSQEIVQRDADQPLLLLAHSMGGHIGLRYMKEHEGVFDSAILTAPMIDIETHGIPKPLARQMVKFAKACGNLEKYVPGGSDWHEGKDTFDKNNVTHDRARYEAFVDFIRHHDNLKIGDATYGWVNASFQSIDILNNEAYLKSIKTPILMQVSGEDSVVSKPAQIRAAALLPMCHKIEIKGARHEIWQESDPMRAEFIAAARNFIHERLEPRISAAPKKPKAHVMMRRPKFG